MLRLRALSVEASGCGAQIIACLNLDWVIVNLLFFCARASFAQELRLQIWSKIAWKVAWMFSAQAKWMQGT